MQNQSNVTSSANEPSTKRGTYFFAVVLIIVALSTYGYKLFTQGIFDCPPGGYGENWYLSYCNASSYGDFDRGAHWYPLVPGVIPSAREADVLVIGSSRMQFGFSSDATQSWFDTHNTSYYLLGFTHTENIRFAAPLLEKIQPNPDVLIINADQFFDDRLTEPTAAILNDRDAPSRYRAKLRWQAIHQKVCSKFSSLCGTSLVIFRNEKTGRWRYAGTNKFWRQTPTGANEVSDRDAWDQSVELAENFIANLNVERSCIILTIVPSPETPIEKARWLADQLNLRFIAPPVENFQTRDDSHLDTASAERWSQMFFIQADEALTQCLRKTPQSGSINP